MKLKSSPYPQTESAAGFQFRPRAGGFPISPCPREFGARKGEWDEENSSQIVGESRQEEAASEGRPLTLSDGLSE
jgi:hypothetical protein